MLGRVFARGRSAGEGNRLERVGARRTAPQRDREASALLMRVVSHDPGGLAPLAKHRDLPPALRGELRFRVLCRLSRTRESDLGQVRVPHQPGKERFLDRERILDVDHTRAGLLVEVMERGLRSAERPRDHGLAVAARNLTQALGRGNQGVAPALQQQPEERCDHERQPREGQGEGASERQASLQTWTVVALTTLGGDETRGSTRSQRATRLSRLRGPGPAMISHTRNSRYTNGTMSVRP